jgi:hypothetical protein
VGSLRGESIVTLTPGFVALAFVEFELDLLRAVFAIVVSSESPVCRQ